MEATLAAPGPLDVSRPPARFRLWGGDPVFGALAPRLYGLRPTLMPQPFEMLVGAVCAQQVNLAFAFTVRGRLVRRFGTEVAVGGQTVYAFPEAERLARAQGRQLRAMQFTGRKGGDIRAWPSTISWPGSGSRQRLVEAGHDDQEDLADPGTAEPGAADGRPSGRAP